MIESVVEKSEFTKNSQDFDDLPVNPDDFLAKAQKDSLIPDRKVKHLSKAKARQLAIDVDTPKTTINQYDSVITTSDVPENVAMAIAFAVRIVPDKVMGKLNLPKSHIEIPTIVTGGALRLKTGQRVPAIVDIVNDKPTAIKMSVENIRISFGLAHNKPGPLDPIINFAAAAHEISDWIQFTQRKSDAIFGINDTDERTRAIKHRESKSEQLSNQIAMELTEEFFGVTVIFGENEESIYTPEPPS